MMAPLPHCGERDFCRCSRKFLDIVSFTIRIWRHALYNCLCSFQNVNRLYSKRPSADQSVNWSIQPVTNVVANAGSTQLSGKASQVSNGTYQVKVQINGGSIYTTSLDSNGHFQFANLPTFQGGETVSLWVQGLSNRTGLPLLTSSTVSQTVAYSVPQLTVTQIIERKNAQGLWEAQTLS